MDPIYDSVAEETIDVVNVSAVFNRACLTLAKHLGLIGRLIEKRRISNVSSRD